jgi:hypothetical protein
VAYACVEREGMWHMVKRLKLCGLVLVALAFPLACNQKDDPATPTIPATPSGGSGGSGGSATVGPEAAGGTPGEEMVRKGERGSSCDSTSDCADDLSCIVTHDCPAGVSCANKSCQPSNFGLMGTGKVCVIHECSAKADCCGEMPDTAPKKCDVRTSVCSTPIVAGCTVKNCVADKDCAPGTCGKAFCSLSATAECSTTADCAVNTCNPSTMRCSVTQTDCSVVGCALNTCPTHYCNCQNPDYLPTSPICTDPDCEGICGFNCEEERCVVDKQCGQDIECAATAPFCAAGKCAECRTKDDCKDKDCVDGHCGPQCEADTQCKVFEACQTGKCVYVGCRSDRECVLKAGNTTPTQDPRLSKCHVADGVGTCVYPCEIDAQCAVSEACIAGVCEYLGCETDDECNSIAGLHNLPAPSPERPWVTTAQCRVPTKAAP